MVKDASINCRGFGSSSIHMLFDLLIVILVLFIFCFALELLFGFRCVFANFELSVNIIFIIDGLALHDRAEVLIGYGP